MSRRHDYRDGLLGLLILVATIAFYVWAEVTK